MGLFIAQSVCNQGILQHKSWELFSFQTALPLSSFLTSLLLFCSCNSKWLSDSHLCSTLHFPQDSFSFLGSLSPISGTLKSSVIFWKCSKSAQGYKNRKSLSSSCAVISSGALAGPLLGDPMMHHVWHNTDVGSGLGLCSVHIKQQENSAN